MTEKNNKQTIKIRKSFMWFYALFYLDDLTNFGVMEDEKFRQLYYALYGYVSEQCDTDIGGDMTDIYVVVEKEKQ